MIAPSTQAMFAAPGRNVSLLFRSRRGRSVTIRGAQQTDGPALIEFLGRLSPQTIYLRYFQPRPYFSPDAASHEVRRLLDGTNRGGVLLALADHNGDRSVVGVAELARIHHRSTVAEVAIVVADSYQAEGIGGALCTQIGTVAGALGLTALEATVIAENMAVPRLLARLQVPHTMTYSQGARLLRIPIDAP